MAKIKHYSKDGLLTGEYTDIETNGVFAEWLINNYNEGDAFTVFKDSAAVENDITHNEEELLKDGYFIVTDTPSDLITIAVVVSVVVSVATLVLIPKPELPQNVSRNRQQESPNNRLGSRSNEPRPLQRIPDIRGEVLSIPDVIMPTYSTYLNDKEVENGFYCVGRKQVQISEVKDGDTPLNLVSGSSAGIYYPGNNPNNTSAPDVQILGPRSDPIDAPVYIPFRSNQVNGITLSPDYDDGFTTYTEVNFLGLQAGTGNLLVNRQGGFPYSIYSVGSNAVFTNFICQNGTQTINLSGVREILSNESSGSSGAIVVSYAGLSPFFVPPISGAINSEGLQEYTDFFYITKQPCRQALINVTAPNGMYKDDGGAVLESASVDFEIQFQEVDDSDSLIGDILTETGTVSGNNQQLKAETVYYDFVSQGSKPGPIKFAARLKRLTPRDINFNGTVVDEIKLEDLYGLADLPVNHDFGDVTTIQTKTTATPFATAVKDRQLNLIAKEMLNVYTGGGNFAPALTANDSAVQSFITDSIDPVIGNRTLQEIDADAILALENEIDSYFGNSDNSRFSYTFDSTDITYQDYAQTVFNAINCIAFREGSLISARFEKPQTIPAMLFTHRSKLPGTETYTRNFNSSNINDGVEFNWVDPETNTTETIYLNNGNPTNPKKFNIAGIRNEAQAIVRASREWNKIRYSKLSCEVEVTAEGRYIQPMDMVSIVKGTRIYTFDGEVLSVDGLELTLSQDVQFIQGDNHSIILKNDDGTTNGINCTQGSETNKVILNQAPQQTIRAGIESRRTEFSFGNEAKQEAQLWTVQEVDLSDKLSVSLKAINYTDQYYDDDI